jgi:hypothetical protein
VSVLYDVYTASEFNMREVSKEKHKELSWIADWTYYTIFKRHHPTNHHTHKNTQNTDTNTKIKMKIIQ